MFFDLILLNRQHKGRFGLAWIAATRGIKHISKKDVLEVNVGRLCDDISEYVCSQSESCRSRFSLRLSAVLINGTLKIYQQQVDMVYDDILKILTTTKSADIRVKSRTALERPVIFATPPTPLQTTKLKRKRRETEKSTPQSEVERLIAAAKATEKDLFPEEEMVILRAREDELTLRESQLLRQVAPIEHFVGDLGAPLSDQELREMLELAGDTVPSARQLFPIEEVPEPAVPTLTSETPRKRRKTESTSTPSEPETGPVTIVVQAQIHVSADVQVAPEVRPKIVEIQPSDVGEAVVEKERVEPQEEPIEIEKAPEEVRPREVLEEIQLDVVGKKEKKVATRKKKMPDLSKFIVSTRPPPRVLRINRVEQHEGDWFDINPYPQLEFKLRFPNFTDLVKMYFVGDGVFERRKGESRLPSLEDSATLRRKSGRITPPSEIPPEKRVTPPVMEGVVEEQRIAPEIRVSAPELERPVAIPVVEEVEMMPTVTESLMEPVLTSTPLGRTTTEVEQRTIEELMAVAAEERMQSPRKRRRLIDDLPKLSKDLGLTITGELPSRELTAEPVTAIEKETAESVSLPASSDQTRQREIYNKVCRGGRLTLEDVCEKPINRLNIARAFSDVLVLLKYECVKSITEENSTELKFIERGPKSPKRKVNTYSKK